MRLSRHIFSITLLAAVFLMFSAALRADTIPIQGGAGFAGGESYGFGISGPSLDLYSNSPDAPNAFPICQNISTCVPQAASTAWPVQGFSSGDLNGNNANYLEGTIQIVSAATYDLLPGAFSLLNVPVTFSGEISGYNSFDQTVFTVDVSGTGTASFVGDFAPYASNMEMNISTGTATIVYQSTPEPTPIVLLVPGCIFLAVRRRSLRNRNVQASFSRAD
jgi:hypothetical protein